MLFRRLFQRQLELALVLSILTATSSHSSLESLGWGVPPKNQVFKDVVEDVVGREGFRGRRKGTEGFRRRRRRRRRIIGRWETGGGIFYGGRDEEGWREGFVQNKKCEGNSGL